jgi:hypothetical protein
MNFIISILGVVVVLTTLFDLYRALACRSWSTTQGVITMASAEIISAYQQTRKLHSTKNQTLFYYDYTVNGEKYLGARIFFGDTFLSLFSFAAAKSAITKYKEGQTVTVYYNPNNPANSVLEPGVKWQALAALVLGVLLIVIAPMFG